MSPLTWSISKSPKSGDIHFGYYLKAEMATPFRELFALAFGVVFFER
jgi:hypothetical protein